MADAPQSAAPAEGAPAAKSRKKLLVIGGGIAVLLAGAGIVLLGGGGKDHDTATEAAAEPSHDPAVVTLEPFVLNLADEESQRFLRIAIHVVLDRPQEASGAESLAGARLRDRLLTLLSGKTADDLGTFEGKESLRAEVRRTAEQLFEEATVLDVYFSEFLVQ